MLERQIAHNMKTKPKDATAPKRNAELRQRKREAGLAPMEVWVRPVDKPRVRAFVAGLIKEAK